MVRLPPSATGPTGFDDSSPATALGSAGSANSSDYEEYTYDPNGNRTSKRLRDNTNIAITVTVH